MVGSVVVVSCANSAFMTQLAVRRNRAITIPKKRTFEIPDWTCLGLMREYFIFYNPY